ncbi:MAG: FAD-dependent oxidoreductase [Desulfarculaceae bacterium]|nr:FAD-dependent oxidoreductase [Desulfarculaceae bacterium]MCF8048391.1 FAD-dependent oxidoreductase [Desulfarculaceae bacterium]MCF8099167.1 FAD-dependent oxidoreductase [Desulfarculaceae bacterium]MCF8121209.1 FAD-dependent oxidoreductase [Desulfarculaceae bacterium]
MTQKITSRPVGAVMVVGGGIAAIQASLDLADSGYYVYMVEKSSAIGGVMSQLDKTFPTNDCSMCILSPKLVEAGRHPNIELITLAEVQEVQGMEGDLTVKVLQKARYVDLGKCIACGACAAKCPKRIPDEFNQGLGKRKAAHVKYPQAVPLKYAIDAENCIYFQKGKCRACEKFCPAGAIDYEQQDQELEINVGAVILAAGFKPYDPTSYPQYAYANFTNVVTALEFERILSASGPWMGHLVRPGDEAEPKKIAWLQCVGSRDLNHCDHPYCSSVCCMYAIKEAVIAKEHSHAELDAAIFFMDMRTYGKDFERTYVGAQEHGVRFVRSRIHSISELPGGSLRLEYVTEKGQSKSEDFDMVVLSQGLEMSPDAADLCRRLGVEQNESRFAATDSFAPVATSRPGVYVCGALAGPKDIPLSVMEASAAACAASSGLAAGRGTLITEPVEVPQRDVRGEAPRVGVFVCSCGINIAGVVDVKAVMDYAATLPNVVYVENNLFTCSQDTQDKMTEVIKEQGLNRMVVAACSPRTHEPLFQETLQAAGINKYLFDLANIRNQDSWVHADDPAAATEKAKDQVRMAVAKASLLEPLTEAKLSILPKAMVIGGGVSGMNAALNLAAQGYETHIVERDNAMGGNARMLRTTALGEDVQEYLGELTAKVEAEPLITVHLGTVIKNVDGFVGNFKTTLTKDSGEELLEHGVALICTGAGEYKPSEYLYGQDSRVMTHLEIDQAILGGELDLSKINKAVFIQCVGSREPERPYCSKVCCTHSVESALAIKEANPEAQVAIIYRDMRTYGDRERLYQEARSKGVIFVRYDPDTKPEVVTEGDTLLVKAQDPILQRTIVLEADLVGLATAIVSHQDEHLAQMFKIPLDQDGWFLEAHVKLRPVDFATDGVFMAGLAHYPKPLEEAVSQAQAAVSRAATVLSRTEMMLPGTVAFIDQRKCVGCGVCWTVCPYQAIDQDENGLAVVNEALCKGCGTCVASCRSGAPNLRGFSNQDVLAQISVMLQG